jgi:PadR family transcriptional regulator PadR
VVVSSCARLAARGELLLQLRYEIMERLAEEFGFEQINSGSVYRTLRQMENEGLCKYEWESSEGGLARSRCELH